MWHDRRLTELLGIEHPIVQAPMAGASTPAMAAAAANAGCLGSLGCAFMDAGALRKALEETRAATNRRINLNFFCHRPPEFDDQKSARAQARLRPFYDELGLGELPEIGVVNFPYGDEIHAAVMQARPGVVSFHFGLPERRLVDELKAEGTVILCTATTPAEARDLEARVSTRSSRRAGRLAATRAITSATGPARSAPWHWCRRWSTRSACR